MAHQPDLFLKFCPPGTDPIEAWALRLSKMPVNLTIKALGNVIAWHALMHGTPLSWRPDFWTATNLRADRPSEHKQMTDAIYKLAAMGFIRPIHNRDLPADLRSGSDLSAILWIEVIVAGGRA